MKWNLCQWCSLMYSSSTAALCSSTNCTSLSWRRWPTCVLRMEKKQRHCCRVWRAALMRPRWERYWMTCAHTLATSTETVVPTLPPLRWQSHDNHVTPLFQPRLFLCVCFALDGLDKLMQSVHNWIRLFQYKFCASQWHINKPFLHSDRQGGQFAYCRACSVRESSLFCQ